MRLHNGWLLVLGAVVSACGGGTTTNSGDSNNPGNPGTGNANQLRMYKAGDEAAYAVTETDQNGNLRAVRRYVDTIEGTITNPVGAACRIRRFQEFVELGGKMTLVNQRRDFIYQDTQGALFDCGFVTEPSGQNVFVRNSTSGLALVIASPLVVGAQYNLPTASYTNGSANIAACSVHVIAKENIQVAAGQFDVFRLDKTCTSPDGQVDSTISWRSPTDGDIRVEIRTAAGTTTWELESLDLK